MTATTNARIAGLALLVYIVAGVGGLVLYGQASAGQLMVDRLASLAAHRPLVGVVHLLSLVMAGSALTLGVTLHGLTRRVDPDLALLGLVCRSAEGIIGATVPTALLMLWLATADGTNAPDPTVGRGMAALLLRLDGLITLTSAIFFSVGSTVFCWLLLRGQLLPRRLAGLGVLASVLLVVLLPLRMVGAVPPVVADLAWVPMLAFEVPAAWWLVVKGAPPAAT